MRLKLEIQPIPASTWGVSLANRLKPKEWNEIRHKKYFDANYTCEICGETKLPLHCHEVWVFDDKRRLQKLAKLECCCEMCHNVHHYGRSKMVYKPTYVKRLIVHWCTINGRTPQQFALYERQIFEKNKKRADKFYQVKIGRRILV